MSIDSPNALLALLACTLLSGCNHYKEHLYPNSKQAVALGTTTDTPILLHVDWRIPSLPPMVPFARIDGDFDGGYNDEAQALELKDRSLTLELLPDVIVFEPRGQAYSGSVGSYSGVGLSGVALGITNSSPVYRPQASAHLYRLAPSQIGLRWDNNGFLRWIDDKAREESGILEGDTLLSIGGYSIERPPNSISELEIAFLGFGVGETLEVTWIRPGSGKMSGSITTTLPPPLPEGIESLAWKLEEAREKAKQRARRGPY